MNLALKLYLTFVAGAGIGSTITYFLCKDHYEIENAKALENYSNYTEKRIQNLIDEFESEKEVDEDEDEEPEEVNNEGIKKYHNNSDNVPEYGSKRIFLSKDDRKDIQDAVKKKLNTALISEIEENEFLNQDGKYEKQTIDVLLVDPEKALWGYQTDNEMDVKAKFGKSLEELVGDEIDWSKITDDSGIGVLYFRNDEIMTDFEVVVHSFDAPNPVDAFNNSVKDSIFN